MSIKAIFPAGVTALTVNGLHQWDYGQTLEIEADDLPALVEVHFACARMDDAVVRACSVVNGVVVAAIPDICLEQTAPVIAWVYEIGETSGWTTKAVTLPIIPRVRPQSSATVPSFISDKYTELVAAINAQVESLKAGSVTVNRALTAAKADEATHAATAAKAYEATQAATAAKADEATHAATAAKADEATHAATAAKADEATHAESADRAETVERAEEATRAESAERADTADSLGNMSADWVANFLNDLENRLMVVEDKI